MYLPYADILFNGKSMAGKERVMVVESHEIAKTMFKCAAECIAEVHNKQVPDPQQKMLYDKWKVGPQIEKIILECVEAFTKDHTYINEAEDEDIEHVVAFVREKDCGKKLHQIHLFPKFFQQSPEITALTLAHEMTHDNSNTVDVPKMDVQTVGHYIAKKYGKKLEHTQAFLTHMMREYPNEMKEALNSQEVAKACTDLDSEEGEDSNEASTLLDKYKNVTPETAESFWSTLTDDEKGTSIELNEVVLCTHISMDKACLLEIFLANDAECIARFAYDCYKYKYKEGK